MPLGTYSTTQLSTPVDYSGLPISSIPTAKEVIGAHPDLRLIMLGIDDVLACSHPICRQDSEAGGRNATGVSLEAAPVDLDVIA